MAVRQQGPPLEASRALWRRKDSRRNYVCAAWRYKQESGIVTLVVMCSTESTITNTENLKLDTFGAVDIKKFNAEFVWHDDSQELSFPKRVVLCGWAIM